MAHIQLTEVRFEGFTANLQTGELFRQGQRVVLPNQSFLALAALLERPGELVSREELRARLWPDKRVVEFEQGLNAVINRLREALGDSAAQPKFIETLPRRGYRFIGSVDAGPGDSAPASRQALPVRLYGLGVLLAIVVAAVSLVRWHLAHQEPFANPTIRRLTSSVGREVSPSFAPDGRSYVFGWNGGAAGDFDLYIKRVDSERLLRLTHAPAVAISPAWAPDGSQIAFARFRAAESGIYSIPATGGHERLLTPASFLDETFMQLSWSPDGRLLAYAAVGTGSLSHIHVLTLAGLTKRELHLSDCHDAGLPAFSPDGRQLAFVCTTSLGLYSVYVTDVSADNPHLLASMSGDVRGMTWCADGRGLVLANDGGDASALWLLAVNGDLSRIPGSEEALGPGLARTRDGFAFVREQHRFELWRIDLTSAGDPGGVLAAASRSQLVPQYSPDGTQVVFESGRSGYPEIWLSDAAGRNPVQLTAFNGPLTGGPAWCSDGRRIAFDSRVSGTSRIYLMDVPDGPSQPLATSQTNLSLPAWSQDCQWIFASDGRRALYRVPAAGGAAELFTRRWAYRAAVSGDNVIFNVARSVGVELWSRPAAGGEERPLAGMPELRYSDDWSVARNGIYYTSGASVSFYDFASHRTRVVRPLTGAPAALGGLGMTISPDGRWLAYTRSADWQGDVLQISGH